jgi:hypothetical protein
MREGCTDQHRMTVCYFTAEVQSPVRRLTDGVPKGGMATALRGHVWLLTLRMPTQSGGHATRSVPRTQNPKGHAADAISAEGGR